MAQYIPSPSLPRITLTPGDSLEANPCVCCESEKELLAMLAILLYASNHAGDHTVADMVDDAKCWCVSDKQMLQSILNVMLQNSIANGFFEDLDEVRDAAKCLFCADPHIIKAIITKQTIEYIDGQWPLGV